MRETNKQTKKHKGLPTKNDKENVCHCESKKTTETVLVFGSLPVNQKGMVKIHSLCRAPSLLKKLLYSQRQDSALIYKATTPVKSIGVDLHYAEETFGQHLFTVGKKASNYC